MLRYRDIEDFLAERSLDISYEKFRRWFLEFSESIFRNLRSSRSTPNVVWHLDEMVIVIRGKRPFLWRPV
ncbi:MAG: IS6 family transposase, partial [Sneathiella sp.]